MKKWLAIVASGLLIGFSFPTLLFGHKLPNLGFLAWFGLVPLLLLLKNANWKQAFRYGWLTSVVYFFFSFHWLYIALHTYGHLNPVLSVLIPLLLASVLALYIGAACGLAKWLEKKCGAPFLFLFPASLTFFEWARNYTPFNGYPWANLPMSQASYTWLIQIADITGVYGVIFLVALMNCVIAGRKLGRSSKVIVAIIFTFTLSYGAFRVNQVSKEVKGAPRMKVGLIQPNIPQDEKWEMASLEKQRGIFNEAVQKLQNHVDLIVWPEASWPGTLPLDYESISPQAVGLTTSITATPFTLLGTTSVREAGGGPHYFNSAILLNGMGLIMGRYHKTHLVPFGEYIPLENFFPFLKPLAVIGDFKAGSGDKPLELGPWKLAPLICYEDIFPELSRRMVQKGSNLLINMTNDAWYGFSSAAFQHVAMAQMRSAETKRAMVRATNTGVSAVIDPAGRVALATPIFERGVISYQVPLLTEKTLYVKFGDWFVASCLAYVILQMVKSKIQNPKSQTNPKTQAPS